MEGNTDNGLRGSPMDKSMHYFIKGLSSIPSTRIRVLNIAWKCSFRASDSLFWPLHASSLKTHTHTHAHTHTPFIKEK